MTQEAVIRFPCMTVTQPIGTFYVGVMDAQDLVSISWSDVQRIERRDVEVFLGIERPLSEERVGELEKYVRTVDATFPTAIILAVSSDDASFDDATQTMSLRRSDRVAKVIDGQHRIAGLRGYVNGAFQANVTMFVDIDLEDQAMMFATINLKQTQVSKSLAYNLYEYAKTRSPRKTAHDLAKFLNWRDGSPLHHRIKILGVATPGIRGETLSQAAFVDSLVPLISNDPDTDWDWIKRGRPLQRVDPNNPGRLIFRNMFIDDDDARTTRIIWNYFVGVQRRWPVAWETTEPGMILTRTTGFAALMNVLPDAYLKAARVGDIPSSDQFFSLFSPSDLRDEDFTSDNFKPGSTGRAALSRRLRDALS